MAIRRRRASQWMESILSTASMGVHSKNFSQEIVQEFQISTTNFDLSTGVTGTGAVNIVTRTGGNDFHGSGYFFFRDHHMAAYSWTAPRSLRTRSVLRAAAVRLLRGRAY